MVQQYTFPDSVELNLIDQEMLPQLLLDDPFFEMFPLVNKDAHLVEWEQKDNYRGLQNVRGLNGAPGSVQKPGIGRYAMEPGVYGDVILIDEKQLTRKRVAGTLGTPIDLTDEVNDAHENLLHREINRIRLIGWTLLSTGTFSVSHANGGVVHTDTFPIQEYDASTWDSFAAATPLADFRALPLLARGKSTSFNATARAFMNRTTFNNMMRNTNANDLGGKLVLNGNNVTSVGDANAIFLANDLPQIEIYDKTWEDEDGSVNLFIPDEKIVVVGRRDNRAPVGEYRMTRNANNPSLEPGPYVWVYDSIELGQPPRYVAVHRGHNGGPVLWYPGSVVVMDVS